MPGAARTFALLLAAAALLPGPAAAGSIPSYDGPVEVRDGAVVAPRKPAAERDSAKPITLYMTSWCPHCKRARAYFHQRGLAFTEIDVEDSEAGRKEYLALGGGGVPIILVGDKVMRGFNPQAFERLRKH